MKKEEIDIFIKSHDLNPKCKKSLEKWINNESLKLPEDTNKLIDYHNHFYNYKNDYDNKDIMSYKTFQELGQQVRRAMSSMLSKKIESKKEIIKDLSLPGSKTIFKNDNFQIIEISNPETAVKYAENTQWCTSDLNVAKNYLSKGNLYIILDFIYYDKYQYTHDFDQIKNEDDINLYEPHIYDLLIELYSDNYRLILNYLFWCCNELPLEENVNIIAKDAKYSYYYARDNIKGPFPQGEYSISQDPYYSYLYAAIVLKSRFELGEAAISRSPEWSYEYAANIINGRFEMGEPILGTDKIWGFLYAQDIINGKFEPIEKIICTDASDSFAYSVSITKTRFLLGEFSIKNSEYKEEYEKEFNIKL